MLRVFLRQMYVMLLHGAIRHNQIIATIFSRISRSIEAASPYSYQTITLNHVLIPIQAGAILMMVEIIDHGRCK